MLRRVGRCRSRVRRMFTVESGDGELYFVVVVVKKKMGGSRFSCPSFFNLT